MSGHVHRNAITPQPDPNGDPNYGFWEVETPSLRDFPQQLRRFQIVRNSDNTISIFAIDVDTAVNPARLQNGSDIARVDLAFICDRNPADIQKSSGAGT